MIFDYPVIHDGVYYAPGENVPTEQNHVENNDPKQITISEVVENENSIAEDVKSVLDESSTPKKKGGRLRKNK